MSPARKQRNPNRGVVLKLHHAAALHRWLELLLDDRRFDNPIVAHETEQAMLAAKEDLRVKLTTIYLEHSA